MIDSSENARDEFLDAPVRDQALAVLILNRQRFDCRLTDVATDGFTVLIPHGTTWSLASTAKLETHDSTYKVKVLKQNVQYEGIEVTLLRLDEITNDDKLPVPQRWIVHGSRCCAVGLIAAMTYCLVAAPGGVTKSVHPVTIREYVAYLTDFLPTTGWWSPKGEALSMPAITIDLADAEETEASFPVNSVSLSQKATTNAALDRTAMLNAAIRSANSRRSRPVNSTTVPWLLPKGQTNLPRCQMTHLAETDLQAFQSGLRWLSATAAEDAIRSLRQALLSVSTTAGAAVAGCPEARLVRSDDAEIYLRTVDGEVELLRVLPIELGDSVPRGPSAAIHQRSRHR
ncbi:MAG: hypothetical protein JSS49_17310 [Planctomycetes bacterium]|nr:hypothetical protein [Planctomycetota bacterium]